MNCKEIDVLLDAHTIGTLSVGAKAEVAEHLGRCRRCADAWLSHEALAGEAVPPPRAGLYGELVAAAVAGTPAPAAPVPSRRPWPAVGLAASALIALALVWLALSQGNAPELRPALADDSAESSIPGLLGDTPRFELELPGYIAGIHYELLASPAPTTAAAGRIEICEFFMFGCIHCYNFESALTAWVESRSDAIDFVRVPAMFSDIARLHAQAFYTAEVLGETDALIGPFYAEIHERGQPLATVTAIREFFGRHGIDGGRFDSTFNSAAVLERLRRAQDLNRRYGVSATPSIGVNGKYLTNASMSGSNEGMLELVDALVEAESASGSCDNQDDICQHQLRVDQFRDEQLE